ncbi:MULTISPECIES: S-formylglutathione hydrolase [unclassified Ketobacter]|uniref:S-formylglutathione hydrolase n=1 Tax=unclassified Ketobacter TaxID=2639109 RepID=UPI000F23222C|nr:MULTISPECIES: S-formylglutathione hydrolase [unclassified Ketobacter]RLT91314.1 MAG: S-formylglutathione hydrolase [Ketobacter sp. GenoA1]RLT98251.1 MAG: S-formylglutathione hydrolase [Ketobacter sp.]
MELLEEVKCFDGRQLRLKHRSACCQCDMVFSLFLPPQVEQGPVPLIWWLSGLTCNDQNFVTKAGAQRMASALGLAIVAPDTSPRGDGVADDPEAAWDFGLGAGFYVNATESPYDRHYHMYDYVQQELPAIIAEAFPLDMARQSIMGHSMGGHGALTLALNHPQQYQSVSAFAPICAPTQCAWGEKALAGYLGPDRSAWANHDAVALLLERGFDKPILVDQGAADGFLENQLKPELLMQACLQAGVPLTLNRRDGYDHSYYFIASFIEDHLRYHGQFLQ